MRQNKALILAKVETVYGTDPVPTAAANAILSSVPTIEILGAKRDRNVVLPYYGKLPPINVGEGIKITFSVELRGAGAVPSTPPRIGALIRACNFTETIDATLGLEFTKYDPNSAENGESVTIYFYRDGRLHKALGCVGSFKMSAKLNDIAKLDFEFTGLYAGAHASDVATPAPTYGDMAIAPLFRSASFTVAAYAALIDALNLDIGNKTSKRSDANTATGTYRYFISDREVKGDCDPEVVALTSFNPWSLWDASTPGALSVTIGSAAQNRCIVTMPSVVPEIPKYGGREEILTYAYSFTSHPTLTAGNNEISIKFN